MEDLQRILLSKSIAKEARVKALGNIDPNEYLTCLVDKKLREYMITWLKQNEKYPSSDLFKNALFTTFNQPDNQSDDPEGEMNEIIELVRMRAISDNAFFYNTKIGLDTEILRAEVVDRTLRFLALGYTSELAGFHNFQLIIHNGLSSGNMFIEGKLTAIDLAYSLARNEQFGSRNS